MEKSAEPVGSYLELTFSIVILFFVFVFSIFFCFTGREMRCSVLNVKKSVQVALLQ